MVTLGKWPQLSILALLCCAGGVPGERPVLAAGADAGRGTAHPALWPRSHSAGLTDPATESFVTGLVSRMSVEEKVGQIIQADIGAVTAQDLRSYPLGAVLAGGESQPRGGGGRDRAGVARGRARPARGIDRAAPRAHADTHFVRHRCRARQQRGVGRHDLSAQHRPRCHARSGTRTLGWQGGGGHNSDFPHFSGTLSFAWPAPRFAPGYGLRYAIGQRQGDGAPAR